MKRITLVISVAVAAVLLFPVTAGARAPAVLGRIEGGFDARSMLDELEQVGRFTPVPTDSGSGRRVVYDNSEQRVWLVDDGDRLVSSYLVSGRKGVPAPGTYSVYSRSEWTTSYTGSVRMEHMVRFAIGANQGWPIGFHAIPVTYSGKPIQSESELGQFRSAGCVRLAPADASLMWDFAQVETPVIVLP